MISLLLKKFKFAPLHLLLWVVVWLFYVYFFSYNTQNVTFVLWFSACLLPVSIFVTYLFSYELIPKYLLPKKYIEFVVYSLYTVIGSLFLIIIIVFFSFLFKDNFKIEELPLLTRNFLFVFVLVYLVAGVVSFINLLRYNFQANSRNKELQNIVLESKLELKQKELYYLKQQIHPHFLFNTLNTVYAFALKQSKETPELILKLSNLLDYVLHQIEKPTVSIYDEVKYIESYIGLESIRFRDTVRINFEKDIQTDKHLPPMLFMAFIENAFKHGGRIDDFLDISVLLSVTNTSLLFTIENTVNVNKDLKINHGIGLNNTRKRLETLYPDSFELTTTKTDTLFTLKLIINYEDESM
jgi:two-component system LytT family sensor kinase